MPVATIASDAMTPQEVLQHCIQNKAWGEIIQYLTTASNRCGSSSSSSSSSTKKEEDHVLKSERQSVLVGKLNTAVHVTHRDIDISIDNCFHLAIVQRAPFYVIDKMIHALVDDGKQGILHNVLTPHDQWTALHLACWLYNDSSPFEKPIVKLLLDVGGMDLVNCQNKNGRTALHVACANAAIPWDVIKMLLNAGGSGNCVSASTGKDLVMKQDEDGYTALYHACITRTNTSQSYDDHVVQALLEVGGTNLVLVKDVQGKTILHHAVIMSSAAGGKTWTSQYIHLISCLLYMGTQYLVSQKDRNGWNALHYLCATPTGNDVSKEQILQLLLDAGGVNLIMAKDRQDGFTALHMACAQGLSCHLIQILLKCMGGGGQSHLVTRLLTKDKRGCMAVDHAFTTYHKNKEDNLDVIQLLLVAGGKDLVLTRNKMEPTILHKACKQKEVYDVIKLLVDVGGKDLVLMKMKSGTTALFEACNCKNYCNVIKLLLDVGGKELVMMKHNKSGSTVLHRVCSGSKKEGNLDVVKLLLNTGGKNLVMAKDENDCTALHKACKHHQDDKGIIQLLLNVGGQNLVMLQDNHGNTALHEAFACCSGSSPSTMGIVQMLLDVGGCALAKVLDEAGSTALHLACKYGASYECMALLLLNVGDGDGNDFVTMTDKDGQTALHVLCQSNNKHTESMKILLEKAAFLKSKVRNNHGLIQMKTKEGKTAFQILLENRYPELHDMWQLLTIPSNEDEGTCTNPEHTNDNRQSNNATHDVPTMTSCLPAVNVNYAKVKREEDDIPITLPSSCHLLDTSQTSQAAAAASNEDDNPHDNDPSIDQNDDVDNLQLLHSQLTATFSKLERSLQRKRQMIVELEHTVQAKKTRMNEMENEIIALQDDKFDHPALVVMDSVQCCKAEHFI